MQERDGYFRSADARLRLREQGQGAAVVFVHAWTLDLDAWEPQAAALADAFRVIRYDRRGFGLSEGVPGRAADAADLGRLLDHLGLDSTALVGASQGARVALAFALAHPHRVRALVLDGPPDELGEPGGAGDADVSLEECRRQVAERGLEGFRRAWQAHPLMRLHAADAAARELVARMLARYPGRDLTGAVQPPPRPAGAAALARLAVPALVLNGEFDTPARRRAGETLARALPRAERLLLSGAGHLPNLDAPRAYNHAIRAFLLRLTRAAA